MNLKKNDFNVNNEQKSNQDSKVALITGGARRIGKELVKALHSANYRVLLHYRGSQDDAVNLCSELNKVRSDSAEMIKANFSDPSEIELCAEKAEKIWGRVDVLINNASSFFPTTIGETTLTQWHELFSGNVMAPYFLIQALFPSLQKQKGHIINIADIHGIRPLKGYSVYSSAKAALIMLTKTLARELGPDIQVNAIAPGPTLWPEKSSNQEQEHVIDRSVLKRFTKVEDIVDTIFFLLKQSSITGEVIKIDCGRSLK